ncbi:minor capsid protein [Streptomyces halstedii]|uniref:minor capsid protein n=1 Tax=Streptomyces halstedii TaxID=1944 RepID=UPI0032548491
MSYTTDLLDGLARLLDAAGIGTYRPTGAYTKGETAITIGTMPPVPDRVICLDAYAVEESAALTDTTTGVQVWTRAGPDPRDAIALDDDVFGLLQGSGPYLWGVARVQLIYRQSAAGLGTDVNGCWQRTSNFYCRAHRAAIHLE